MHGGQRGGWSDSVPARTQLLTSLAIAENVLSSTLRRSHNAPASVTQCARAKLSCVHTPRTAVYPLRNERSMGRRPCTLPQSEGEAKG
eukprot:260381-Chlamydomonas_euryale.AAC.2